MHMKNEEKYMKCVDTRVRACAHHSILGDDEAADVVGGHSADGVVHRGALVDLVVDVEVARLLPRVLRCAHVYCVFLVRACRQGNRNAGIKNKREQSVIDERHETAAAAAERPKRPQNGPRASGRCHHYRRSVSFCFAFLFFACFSTHKHTRTHTCRSSFFSPHTSLPHRNEYNTNTMVKFD